MNFSREHLAFFKWCPIWSGQCFRDFWNDFHSWLIGITIIFLEISTSHCRLFMKTFRGDATTVIGRAFQNFTFCEDFNVPLQLSSQVLFGMPWPANSFLSQSREKLASVLEINTSLHGPFSFKLLTVSTF